jgi:DNA repair protein RadC
MPETLQSAKPKCSNWNQGHRKRLCARYVRASDTALEDHELLELLLTFAIPRLDTKPLARRLLERFGSLNTVLGASSRQLQEVCGIGPRAALLIGLVVPLAARSLAASRNERITLTTPEDAGEYFRTKLNNLQVEQVHAAYVNARNAVTAVECLQEGTVDHSTIYPRQVLERALLHKASGFLLAHNHPSGDTSPSQQDIHLTEGLVQAARSLGVRFLDHLIIGEGEPFSFRRRGLMS